MPPMKAELFIGVFSMRDRFQYNLVTKISQNITQTT